MKITKYVLLISTFLFFSVVAVKSFSSPPKPPVGKVWVLNEAMSDEFDASSPGVDKWRVYQRDNSWDRSAAFDPRVPQSVKESGTNNYYLAMNPIWYYEDEQFTKNDRTYEFAGGAMDTKVYQTYGYFEVRIKPSNFPMGSGVFMNSRQASSDDCDTKYHTELDIIENMGYNGPGYNANWNNHQHSGSHIKPYQTVNGNCVALPYESVGSNVAPLLDDPLGFNIVGMWWEDENTVKFYNNDEYFSTVTPSRPCNLPMPVIIVMETYYWGRDDNNNAGNPKPAEYMFEDDFRTKEERSVMYDWVRVWKLVDIDSNNFNEETDNVMFLDKPKTAYQEDHINMTVVYSATEARDIIVEVFDEDNKLLGDTTYTVAKGVHSVNAKVNFESILPVSADYRMVCSVRPVGGDSSSNIKTDTSTLLVEKKPIVTSITGDKLPLSVEPSSNGYDVQIDYQANEEDGELEIVVTVSDPEGQWLGNGITKVSSGTGTANVHINTSNATTYGNGYSWGAHIRPVGSSWREAIDVIDQVYFNIEDYKEPEIKINSISSPAYSNSTSIDVTFTYKAESDGELDLQLLSVKGDTIAAHCRSERLGNRTITRALDIQGNIEPSNDYMMVVNYKPTDSGSENLTDTLKNVEVKNITSSSRDLAISNRIRIFPNPVNDYAIIQLLKDKINCVEIYNVLGIPVKAFSCKQTIASDISLDMSDLISGTYIVRAKSDSQTYHTQIVKN